MATRRRRAAEEGFTLIESMIAMFILAYIVGQMAMLSVYASHTSQLSRRLTRANMLADEAIAKSRNCAYSNLNLAIADLAEACVAAGDVSTCTSTSAIDGVYTRVRTVTPILDDSVTPVTTQSLASSNKSDVSVTVNYTDANGVAQTIQVGTVVSRY
jgi:prepilin-type N-terminal cleavage/methylation domain-containing protein